MKLIISLFFMTINRGGAVPQISPASSLFAVADGQNLDLTCIGDSSSTLIWMKNSVQVVSDAHVRISKGVKDGKQFSIMSITDAVSTQSGAYRCVDQNSGTDVSLNIDVIQVDTTDALFEYRKGAHIACKVKTVRTSDTFTYSWEYAKDGGLRKVSEIPAPHGKKFVEHTNGELEFLPRKATREDAGQYHCHITRKDAYGQLTTFSKFATLYATPFVVPFENPSVSLDQKERLILKCAVLGWPKPSVIWFKDDVEITLSDPKYKLASYQGFSNAELSLDSADYDDIGLFKCIATAQHIWFDPKKMTSIESTYSEVIRLRIHGTMKFMWPLLGIAGEVLLLITIIYISEVKKRRDEVSQSKKDSVDLDLDGHSHAQDPIALRQRT